MKFSYLSVLCLGMAIGIWTPTVLNKFIGPAKNMVVKTPSGLGIMKSKSTERVYEVYTMDMKNFNRYMAWEVEEYKIGDKK